MMAPGRGTEAAVFPDASSEDFFVSGLDSGATQLGGTSAVVDEAVGQGRATIFTFDPVFRGWTDGTQRILWNAIVGPDPFPGAAARAGSPARADEERVARAAALRLPQVAAPFRLTVARSDARATARVLTALGAPWVRVARARRRAVPDREPAGALRRGASVRGEARRGARGSGRRRAIAQPAVSPSGRARAPSWRPRPPDDV